MELFSGKLISDPDLLLESEEYKAPRKTSQTSCSRLLHASCSRVIVANTHPKHILRCRKAKRHHCDPVDPENGKKRIFHFWQVVSQIKGLGKPVWNLQEIPDFWIQLMTNICK